MSCSNNFSSMFVKKVFAGVGLASVIGSTQVGAIPGGCKDFLWHLCMCCLWDCLRTVVDSNSNSTNRSRHIYCTEEEESNWKKPDLSQACGVSQTFKSSEEVELKEKDGYINLYKLFSGLRFSKSDFSSCEAFLKEFVDFLDKNEGNIRFAENLKNTNVNDSDLSKYISQFKAMCKSEKFWENGKYFFEGLKLLDIKIEGLRDLKKSVTTLKKLLGMSSSMSVHALSTLCVNEDN